MSSEIMDIRINKRLCTSLKKSYLDTKKERPYRLFFDFDHCFFTISELSKVDLELLSYSILDCLKEE